MGVVNCTKDLKSDLLVPQIEVFYSNGSKPLLTCVLALQSVGTILDRNY